MKDLYYILGVDKNATPVQIDNAYAVLSAKLRPTGNESDSFLQNHFNEVTDAYSILSNPNKRKAYDATLKRAHLKQLARFKAKTTNAVIAASVILVTGLLGFYLVTLINSHKATTKVAVVDSTVVAQTPKKHHKHKKRVKALIAHRNTKPVVLPNPANAKPVVAVFTPTKPKTDKIKKIVIKPIYAAIAKPVVVKKDTVKQVKPVVAETPVKHLILVKSTTQRDSSYVTYLKNNLRDSVYMHQMADYMSPVVTALAANAKVKVLEKGRTFYKIAQGNGTGYVPKWALVKQ